MKIVSVIGARPQFVKAATISRNIGTRSDIKEVILHTGQHYDENMSRLFFEELNIPEPHHNLGIGSGSHAWQTGRMLEGIEAILLKEKPDWTLLYGDTNSTVAGALAATKLHIPIAHVEAGLRSFNRVMPEEINRIVTDRISDLLCAPTETAMTNLRNEGLADITKFTGDVMYDSVLYYRNIVEKDPAAYSIQDLPKDFLLATIHRAENTDYPQQMRNILNAVSQLPFPVLFPIHPRTKKIISGFSIPSNLRLIEPVGYLMMLSLIMKARKVLTDSGGLQKEAYFLGTPCITIRTETEWIETLQDGWNTLTGTTPEKIVRAVHLPLPKQPQSQAFGKGNAAEIIIGLFTETC